MSLLLKDYLELEAEESDEETKDDTNTIKNVNVCEDPEPEEEKEDQDTNVDNLINDKKINPKNKLLRSKFIDDQLTKDEEEIQQILKGYTQKRKFSSLKKEKSEDEHIKQICKKQKNHHQNLKLGMIRKINSPKIFPQDKKLVNVSKYKQRIIQSSQDDSDVHCQPDAIVENQNGNSSSQELLNEEMNEILLKYEKNIKKKIIEESSEFKKKLNERMKEDDKILENVINLNNVEVANQNPKGKCNVEKKKENQNKFMSYSQSQRYSQNSVLNAIKNNKNFLTSEKLDSEKPSASASTKLFPLFMNSKFEIDSEKKKNISRIFDKSEVTCKISLKECKSNQQAKKENEEVK